MNGLPWVLSHDLRDIPSVWGGIEHKPAPGAYGLIRGEIELWQAHSMRWRASREPTDTPADAGERRERMNDNDVIHLSAIAWLGTIASRCLDSLGRATEPFGRDVPDLSPALRAAVDQATAGHEALRTSAEAELHRALEDSR